MTCAHEKRNYSPSNPIYYHITTLALYLVYIQYIVTMVMCNAFIYNLQK